MDPAAYCREVETYLCRKNDGHLVRVVGPAFELVSAWADQGIPLKIAFAGIDRTFERYYAKGSRRRPVRIEFCEPDVLDRFDDWRRAVGLSAPRPEAGAAAEGSRPREGLQKHVQRVLARLTALASDPDVRPALRRKIEQVIQTLELSEGAHKTVRGAARAQLIEGLASDDAALIGEAREACKPAEWEEIDRAARAELEPFRIRMAPAAFEAAVTAAANRLLRERARLPHLEFDH
jgi:hypothetical protein